MSKIPDFAQRFGDYNKQSVRMRLWTQGIRRNKEQIEKSSQMSEEAALELGAEIVANSVTFVIGLIAILMQQSISAAQERKKVEAEENKLHRIEKNQLELNRKLMEIGLDIHRQDAKLRELERIVLLLPQYSRMPVSNTSKPDLKQTKPPKSDSKKPEAP